VECQIKLDWANPILVADPIRILIKRKVQSHPNPVVCPYIWVEVSVRRVCPFPTPGGVACRVLFDDHFSFHSLVLSLCIVRPSAITLPSPHIALMLEPACLHTRLPIFLPLAGWLVGVLLMIVLLSLAHSITLYS
jgi:hypothetical protein